MESELRLREDRPAVIISPYDVIPYEPEFKAQVLELQRELWSPSLDLNNAYFDWKYERNPYVPEPVLYLAMHGRSVVGMRSYFGVRWEAGSPAEVLNALYADDLVVTRNHRNRGVTARIMETSVKSLGRKGYQYLLSLSAGQVTTISALSKGWKQVGVMQPLLYRPWVGRVLRGLSQFRPGFEIPQRSLEDINPDEVARRFEQISFAFAPRVEEMARLVERLGSDGRIRHVRDCTYLHWRFQNPLHRYGFLFCDRQELAGYLVLQEYRMRDRITLNIVDWEATSKGELNRLLGAARFVAGRDRVLTVWSATLSTERLLLLAENGFRRMKERPGLHQPPLLIQSIAPGNTASPWLFAGRQLRDLSKWDLRMLYSMLG